MNPMGMEVTKLTYHSPIFIALRTSPTDEITKSCARSEPEFVNVYCKKPRNRLQGTDSASLCSLAGRYNNDRSIPGLLKRLKIRAQESSYVPERWGDQRAVT
jgi:hypothetical protein